MSNFTFAFKCLLVRFTSRVKYFIYPLSEVLFLHPLPAVHSLSEGLAFTWGHLAPQALRLAKADSHLPPRGASKINRGPVGVASLGLLVHFFLSLRHFGFLWTPHTPCRRATLRQRG